MPLLLFADLFQNFFKKFFQEHYQSVKGLDPDQDRHSVGHDLGPNCLQRLSAEDKSRCKRGQVTREILPYVFMISLLSYLDKL